MRCKGRKDIVKSKKEGMKSKEPPFEVGFEQA